MVSFVLAVVSVVPPVGLAAAVLLPFILSSSLCFANPLHSSIPTQTLLDSRSHGPELQMAPAHVRRCCGGRYQHCCGDLGQ